MTPQVGQIYLKHISDRQGFRLDRRLILDVTSTQVLYEELFDVSVFTTIEDNQISRQKQIGIKDWRRWAREATLEGA